MLDSFWIQAIVIGKTSVLNKRLWKFRQHHHCSFIRLLIFLIFRVCRDFSRLSTKTSLIHDDKSSRPSDSVLGYTVLAFPLKLWFNDFHQSYLLDYEAAHGMKKQTSWWKVPGLQKGREMSWVHFWTWARKYPNQASFQRKISSWAKIVEVPPPLHSIAKPETIIEDFKLIRWYIIRWKWLCRLGNFYHFCQLSNETLI